jgi:hypothetical protein
MKNLVITHSELSNLMNDDLDGFDVLYNDIPKDGHSSQYIEDDGRQYRQFEFKRLLDGETFNFSYTWNPHFGFETSDIFDSLIKMNIEVIDDPVVVPEPIPEPVLTQEQQADKDLMQQYNDAESNMVDINDDLEKIPNSVIKELINYLNTSKYNMYELRAKIFPVSIKYNIEHKSLWHFLQRERGAWK